MIQRIYKNSYRGGIMKTFDSIFLSVIEWFSILFPIIYMFIRILGPQTAGMDVLSDYLLLQWFVIITTRIIHGIIKSRRVSDTD